MGKKKKHISEQILDKWIMFCERKKRSCFSYQIEKELGSLNPGINKDKMVHNFYQDKIKCGLLVLGFGGICVMGCIGNGVLYGDLEKERYLEREESGIRTIVLDAQIGNEVIEDVLIEIDAKKRTDAEVKKILEEAAEELEEAIKGENENLQEVRHPLCLINVWETADINIFWTSSNYGLIQEDGSFGEDSIPKEGEEVRLTAVLSCQELQIKKEISVKVFPKEKTEKERIKDELLILVEQQKDKSKSEEYLELPSRLDNTEIIWKEQKTEKVFLGIVFMLVAVFAVFWGKDRDVHRKYEERNRQLQLEYSEFVSKLQLLVCSGMSMRNAFITLGNEYQGKRKQNGVKKYVYEELLIVNRKMENGMSEMDAYDYFAKRCDLICYKRLVAIISQNVRKGTDGLKQSLLEETKDAFEERKQTAKKLGEEAGTKLLLPMMMIMGVVLIIIVIPAYFAFGGM